MSGVALKQQNHKRASGRAQHVLQEPLGELPVFYLVQGFSRYICNVHIGADMLPSEHTFGEVIPA